MITSSILPNTNIDTLDWRSSAAGDTTAFPAALAQAAGGDSPEAVLREAAEQMVATTFITPVLNAMRDSSMATGPFAPSTTERRFGPLLDQQLADHVTRAANFSLVDTIVDRYLPKQPSEVAMLERTVA